MEFDQLPKAARSLWAKSGEVQGHGLLAHMLDVAAVAEALLHRESEKTLEWAAQAFGLPLSSTPRWLAAMAGLHDFGKGIPGFQAKWPEGQTLDEAAGLPFSPVSRTVARHDVASAALLRRVFSARFPEAAWIDPITQALAAHHGYMPKSSEIANGKPRYEGGAWLEAREALFAAYWQTLVPEQSPSATAIELPAVAWLAGLTSVADWIGSNQDWFPPGERDRTLSGHYQRSLEPADRALSEIGWPRFHRLLQCEADSHALVRRILNRAQIQARPLQLAADRLLARSKGPALMIVEAPMGEGKTELAFLAHLRLQAANGHRGLYVALPTQATGNAMFDRALTFLQGCSPDIQLDMQLVHAGALLDSRVHRLRDVDHSPRESVSASAWFSQRKRPLLSPYGVGTVDQALFATLHVKHHFVRLWGLANRVVVLDEVHAYDTYTSGLIAALLRWLRAMNCSVVLMSATLPAKTRAAFLGAWGATGAPELPYPRVLMTREAEVIGEHVECRPLAPVAIVGIAEGLDMLRDAGLEALSGGGCGAVIVNTVQRAQDLYRLMQEDCTGDTELLLFHARYPADERSERERQVLAYFGNSADCRRPARALLIATQVVEQSLDVDFDFMLTDLAPVDLLLQRAGRLHRHFRVRPIQHREPRLFVAGFQREREPELIGTAWGFVYDPYVLYRTWGIAGKETVWHLPQDIDRLVQAVYGDVEWEDENRAEFAKKLDRALGEHFAEIQKQRQQAINVSLDAAAEPQNAYTSAPRANEEREGEGLPVVTRLGEEGLAVVPVHVTDGGWCLFAGEPPFDPNVEFDDALARRLFQRQVRLSRKDVVLALAAESVPAGFESHPLVRNLKPLRLCNSEAAFGKLRVRLDSELGITYQSKEEP
ncbi:CRISPR-associated helicase Cas3' [Methylolobus aquaticus]|nr:CRISPR-associated helicase Cas3' [Methylolobus aquaticus]